MLPLGGLRSASLHSGPSHCLLRPFGTVSNGPLPLPLSGGGQAPEGEHPNLYALVFGNEVAGVQQEVVDACDFALEIPQQGTKHSLNVSVSIGVVLWGIMAH